MMNTTSWQGLADSQHISGIWEMKKQKVSVHIYEQ